MDYKLKNRDGVETTYTKEQIKIPAATGDSMVVFTQGEVQDSVDATITENGTTNVTPDVGFGSMKKVRVTVDVPATVQRSYVVNLQKENGVLTADKTYVDIASEGNRQLMANEGLSIQLIIWFIADGLCLYATTVIGKTIVFQGTGIIDGKPVLVSCTVGPNDTWAIATTPLSNLIVTLVKSGNTYSGNSSFDEINAVIDAGGTVQVYYDGVTLHLASCNESTIAFSGLFVIDKTITAGFASVNANNIWTYDVEDIKTSTSGS